VAVAASRVNALPHARSLGRRVWTGYAYASVVGPRRRRTVEASTKC